MVIADQLGYGSQAKVTREKIKITKLLQKKLSGVDENGNKNLELFEGNTDYFLQEYFVEKLIENCKC